MTDSSLDLIELEGDVLERTDRDVLFQSDRTGTEAWLPLSSVEVWYDSEDEVWYLICTSRFAEEHDL